MALGRRHHALKRVSWALGAAVATALLMPARAGQAMRALASWDVAAAVLAGQAWWILLHAAAAETRRRAAEDDPGRSAVWALVLAASTFSLFATTFVIHRVRAVPEETRVIFVALCVGAVIASWVLTHTAYALRYAHLYYRDDEEGEGGLQFPVDGGPPVAPSYLDFAYFAFTVGMCFQVSDVTVSSRQIRRAVLAHAMLSFAYNTVILAIAINLLVGLFG